MSAKTLRVMAAYFAIKLAVGVVLAWTSNPTLGRVVGIAMAVVSAVACLVVLIFIGQDRAATRAEKRRLKR